MEEFLKKTLVVGSCYLQEGKLMKIPLNKTITTIFAKVIFQTSKRSNLSALAS